MRTNGPMDSKMILSGKESVSASDVELYGLFRRKQSRTFFRCALLIMQRALLTGSGCALCGVDAREDGHFRSKKHIVASARMLAKSCTRSWTNLERRFWGLAVKDVQCQNTEIFCAPCNLELTADNIIDHLGSVRHTTSTGHLRLVHRWMCGFPVEEMAGGYPESDDLPVTCIACGQKVVGLVWIEHCETLDHRRSVREDFELFTVMQESHLSAQVKHTDEFAEKMRQAIYRPDS
eukprot:131727_1